ncbi:aminoglycoside N(3)-acetyltransferase [Sanguibacter sp. A247]|uniref:aminoglycoside N(3)-acetyltransferase n=1 Tax=unclassified Sanguibacter TaxID=2645534 RepID=UPI003FD8FA5C
MMPSPLTRTDLVDALRTLGVGPGDDVLVHSSLRGLGYVDGGATTVVAALIDAVGPDGTVLFPTITATAEHGPAHPPRLDLATAPGWTGAIPEAARLWPGAVRSAHPTHSVVAIGARSRELTAGHARSVTPCDASSPYGLLADGRGRVLLLGGVTHESSTSLHGAEERAGVPHHLQDEPTNGVVVMPDGHEVVVRGRLHLWGWDRHFDRAAAPLRAAGMQRDGVVGAGAATLVEARGYIEVIVPLLREDPTFLLARHELARA